jgi:hypothetical protein
MQQPIYFMKHLYLTLLFAFIFGGLTAQNYAPFNAGTVKSFTTYPEQGPTYSLGFDSTTSVQGVTGFYPYSGLEEYEIVLDETCPSLGENLYCFPETKPSWIGNNIVKNQISDYTFETNFQGLVPLNFNLPEGTSVVFYQDEVSRFSITGMSKTEENIFGITDSIARIVISHTDLNGNPINSQLNDFIIKTGKESGLITFFRIDSFPQILEPVMMIGSQNPSTGLTQITNEDLYDYQPGDQLQYNERSDLVTCHTEVLFDRFINLTFLTRTNTPDSVIYTAFRETFQRDSLESFFDTARLAYARHTVVAQIPFDYNSHEDIYRVKKLSMEDYCGVPRWTYRQTLLNYVYCEESNCWGTSYNRAAPSIEVETSVVGVGRYYYTSAITVELDTYVYTYQLNFFNKGDNVCGDEQIVAADDIKKPVRQLIITPNPATDYIEVSGAPVNTVIQVLNLNGQVIKSTPGSAGHYRIYVGDLQKGVYFVKAGSVVGKAVIR